MLNSLVPRHREVAGIRDLVRESGVTTHMHTIKDHVGYAYNVDALKIESLMRPLVTTKPDR